MDFFTLGEHINVKDYNSLVYLLRKFKRLNTGLRLGSLSLESDYGSFVFDGPLTSVGGNFIIEQEVNVSSSDCLKNCFYSFVFTVIDVNTSGTVNKRQVKVTGGTGDNGTLFITLPTDLIESDEVILPDFELDIVFDEHEYYTPVVDVVNVDLVSDKRFVMVGETATVTATLTDSGGELLVGVPCNINVNGTLYHKFTDENGQASVVYTGTGEYAKIDIRVITTVLTLYDTPMTATYTGSSASFSGNMVATDGILIDWGDGTTSTTHSHNYTDGQSEHTITFIGEITSIGTNCFFGRTRLTSITIPDSVIRIGAQCFAGCTGLTSITISDSVINLGAQCFYNCTGLTSITIPDTVIFLGGQCFQGCSALVDYRLYWTNEDIIPYDSNKMPNNTNTIFKIPENTTNNYTNKGYPANKLIERRITLTITADKTIITTDETSTVTATLLDTGEAVGGETLSYTIKNGESIITTGTDTTDSNGEISFTYTGTGIGEITVEVNYDSLTETYTVWDTLYHDEPVSDTSGRYTKTHCSLTFDNDKLIMTRTENGECYVQYMTQSVVNPVSLYKGKTIRFECDIVEATANSQIRIYQQVSGTYSSVASDNTTSGHLTVESTIDENATSVLFRIVANNIGTGGTCSFKNIKIYQIPTNEYALSVASTKDILSHADSESATITATLTDNSVAVAGETLSYTIKHGTSTISSGSDTTDSNGQISFTYASTGIGDITVEVSYGTLLQEIYEIKDLYLYDPMTSNSGHWNWDSNMSHNHNSNGVTFNRTTGSGNMCSKSAFTLPSNFEVEYTYVGGISYSIETNVGGLGVTHDVNGHQTWYYYRECGNQESGTVITVQETVNSGDVFKITRENHVLKVYRNDVLKHTITKSTDYNYIEFVGYNNARQTTLKDIKIKAL